ncbi:TPA: type I-E CRISPR-associated endonuclease Cas1 [Candidatus Acetothermia bacterium]|nr:type I-E CRISPR-associated endonuclease Cas1 [Candidatus Acetothermia bacterium]
MLQGRLGLETARIPHAERHGLLWLERGKLYVQDGNLTFVTVGTETLKKGVYQIPFQTVSNILLAPGCTISHDALRLLARQGTGLLVVGLDGVRFYAASMPFGPDRSRLARKQVFLWADEDRRINVARNMYFLRLGEVLPHTTMDALRGAEGKRMKAVYQLLAKQYGVNWKGRSYDRTNPNADDTINTAINHVSAAVRAAAMIAVSATATIPQLGFIHESAGVAFALDIADLYRTSLTLPTAFAAVKQVQKRGWENLERLTRRMIGEKLRRGKVISAMIDDIKELLNAGDIDHNS